MKSDYLLSLSDVASRSARLFSYILLIHKPHSLSLALFSNCLPFVNNADIILTVNLNKVKLSLSKLED